MPGTRELKAKGKVDASGRLTAQVDAPPGEYSLTVYVEDKLPGNGKRALNLPVLPIGLIDPERQLHREELYDE